MQYKSIELTSCVKGEQINIIFSGSNKLCLALLTQDGYKSYEKNIDSVKRYIVDSSPARFIVSEEGILYLVADLDGTDVNSLKIDIEGRYAPNLKEVEIRLHCTNPGKVLVKNAEDTTTDGSMIQHWIDNKLKASRINLDKFTCPSCGCPVSRNHIHGAHVQKVRGSKWYITPTCDSCNTSKTKRIFRVAECDLVEAPND